MANTLIKTSTILASIQTPPNFSQAPKGNMLGPVNCTAHIQQVVGKKFPKKMDH